MVRTGGGGVGSWQPAVRERREREMWCGDDNDEDKGRGLVMSG